MRKTYCFSVFARNPTQTKTVQLEDLVKAPTDQIKQPSVGNLHLCLVYVYFCSFCLSPVNVARFQLDDKYWQTMTQQTHKNVGGNG